MRAEHVGREAWTSDVLIHPDLSDMVQEQPLCHALAVIGRPRGDVFAGGAGFDTVDPDGEGGQRGALADCNTQEPLIVRSL